ncbi:hypothetical protein [Winogradskyella sp. UBA3174]|uniref:hypothetical protein n=1 Tax=Winogradskyella sp. UBA3174 TaxID=1947785 RepID=UPI0025D73214|nr:hypothetical protein [Winogradskyella sp. UBA3174]|tara:strand:- start:3030 stop:3824 length:795 start_codon:yes stop_codon:yes gene_type:complete
MYSKFKINKSSLENISFNIYDKTMGDSISTKYKKEVDLVLKDKFEDNKHINGSKIQEEWFPKVKSDIFLSHSHKDIDKAKQFAGWAKNKFNLDVFIDYNIWGNINNLLKKIDNAYCYDKIKKTYSYEKRNFTTSHVHMMLINALSDMIDRTECLMFFETPNSIDLKKMTHTETTESPWIYNELFLSKIIQKKQRRQQTNLIKAQESVRMYSHLNESFNPSYETDTSHLINLSKEDLQNWLSIYEGVNKKESHSLDVLYKIKNIK